MANNSNQINRKLTPKKMQDFLMHLAEYGNVSEAAKAVSVGRTLLYYEKSNNEDFKDAWEKAEKLGVAALEDEARRRAFEGWDEPIFYKGDVCGTVRKFSDTLLIFLLKGHKPEKYRDKVDVTSSDRSMSPGPAVAVDLTHLTATELLELTDKIFDNADESEA